jgi:hypothetical protein
MMSKDEARGVLQGGGKLADLAEAIAIVASDPTSSEADIRLGLRHRGFVAEQAQFALERRGFYRDFTANAGPVSTGKQGSDVA